MSVKIFLSTVSDEFRVYRDALHGDLTRHNVEVKVQEDFKGLGGDTLDKLDVYIKHCDAVVHLAGDMIGSAPEELPLRELLQKYPKLAEKLPPLGEALRSGVSLSYTQWEAWLALYHDKSLFIVKAGDGAERGPSYAPTEGSRAAQAAHLAGLRKAGRYPGYTFASPADLAKHIAYTGILDLLVQAYGEEIARARDVAEGFIREMATRVAGDRTLDFEGMQQAVRTAIDLYESEIAGGQTRTNIDAIVDEALAWARSLVDAGKSGLARAALRKAAESMRREEEERRERYVAGVTALYHRARDIALAAYDGEAAAEAIIALADAVHGANAALVARSVNSEAAALYEYGRDRGSNVHLVALIILRRKLLDAASSDAERGRAHDDLGTALATLGERESGTERLDEAVAAFHDALKEKTRERAPLDWAVTQNNLGNALAAIGERESSAARLEEAVAAYREALKEWTRERLPLEWATAQNNLGSALSSLGERENGTARLQEAVAAYREALTERTRERVPLDWATTQNNLGNALLTLGRRESGTARLEEAVAACREALKERTRERVPLDWATTQNNLGNALFTLGEGESGTARLGEAVAAYRDALKEWTRERVPLQWAMTQSNLGAALSRAGELESGTARLEEAVAAYRAALKERTRQRVPLEWAKTQNNLGATLSTLGERESGTARLEEAVTACREALKERTRERVPLQWAMTQNNLGDALLTLGERTSGTARLEEAVGAYREALKEWTRENAPHYHDAVQKNIDRVLKLVEERAAKNEISG
jgi:tetratricopeptide (TPR) repeat protein